MTDAERLEIENLRRENLELREVITRLRAELEKLRRELDEWKRGHRERRKRRSSRAEGASRPEPRTPGRKPGHVAAHRAAPDHVDREQAHPTPSICPDCRGEVEQTGEELSTLEVDIPPVRPVVTRHTTCVGRCKRCWRRVVARLPGASANGTTVATVTLGPNVQSLALSLRFDVGADPPPRHFDRGDVLGALLAGVHVFSRRTPCSISGMTIRSDDGYTAAEAGLREFRAKLGKMKVAELDAVKVEEDIRAHLDALGRELLAEVFALADIDDQEVRINGVLHGRVDRHVAKIHSSFGIIEQGRSTYRKERGSPPVAPFDKILGIVEGFYTPKCAKILCRLPALLVREDVVAIVGELGGIAVGAATMHRLPQAVMARYEGRRDDIERTVRERTKVPDDAVCVQVGIDGVMVPQEGQHCKPRGRTPTEDPAPARHTLKYGEVTPKGPAATDGHADRSWHEGSVGTLAYFNADGDHLETQYLGRMPEENKETLAEMLEAEVQHALVQRPDLVPVLASDGAPGHWTTLAAIRQRMPEPARERAVDLIDFFHVAEHLQEAADAIDGKGSAEARIQRVTWGETLKEHDDGPDRVLQALRYQRRIAKRESVRDEIDAVIGYVANNKHRMHFKEAIARHMPIATGPTEAAAKTLVGVRMKRSGARFSQHGGQTILTLLAAHKSRRFDDLFDVLAKTYTAPVSRAA